MDCSDVTPQRGFLGGKTLHRWLRGPFPIHRKHSPGTGVVETELVRNTLPRRGWFAAVDFTTWSCGGVIVIHVILVTTS